MIVTRRSTRLAARDVVPSPDTNTASPAEADREPTQAKRSARSQVPARPKKKLKANSDPSQTQSVSQENCKLLSLAPELLEQVLSHVQQDTPTLRSLTRTCKGLYSLLMPLVHRRISTTAYCHAHITHLIKALEPYLSIAQKKKLKSEGKYKGQQARYPTGLDEKFVPFCAGWVKQFAVGHSNPGKKHRYIVLRYVEEALKNLKNVEMVKLCVMSSSIASTLPTLKNLKALDLHIGESDNDRDSEDLEGLTKIQNLKWLEVTDHGWHSHSRRKTLMGIIANSASTLERLRYHASHELFDGREPLAQLTALKSLSLKSYYMNGGPEPVKEIFRIVDFTQLTQLEILGLDKVDLLFFAKLANVARAAAAEGRAMQLRQLHVSFYNARKEYDMEVTNRFIDSVARLIHSFDSLVSLQLTEYGEYPTGRGQNPVQNPGLAGSMLRAVLRNRKLKTLKCVYNSVSEDWGIPRFTAANVGALVDGLPELQHIEFAPLEAEMEEIAQALTRGTQLRSIYCFQYDHFWPPRTGSDDPKVKINTAILEAFLMSPHVVGMSGGADFSWEDYFKLRQVECLREHWAVGSKASKRWMNDKSKPVMLTSKDGDRQVGYLRFDPRGRLEENEEWLAEMDMVFR